MFFLKGPWHWSKKIEINWNLNLRVKNRKDDFLEFSISAWEVVKNWFENFCRNLLSNPATCYSLLQLVEKSRNLLSNPDKWEIGGKNFAATFYPLPQSVKQSCNLLSNPDQFCVPDLSGCGIG